MAMKYFWYSQNQLDFRRQQEAKLGRTFRVGHVFTGGARKPYTEITSTPNPPSRYSDVRLVTSGDQFRITYTPPEIK